ncbi:hypothetical protein A3F28_03405 [Candidatus Uhrbacteria bacterium RIFCSPHIGHO2_12_FULL_57_11]|uniref:Transmembrane protein n=1 Tax=Candidatus Uhrbacteria bacterium RIFCSPHIGHO2_12_FULL_57_11 TaxID=1802398 RepID=A0A1F7UIT0_9BACT|nr:MAG: hypothetical protein A3F28_03405 [Candidatus Uhrbacteria bacterium RIFCSPHIGHO2_12_FULL_57_11]
MDPKFVKLLLGVVTVAVTIVGILAIGWILLVTPRPCVQFTAYGYDTKRCAREEQCYEHTDQSRVQCYAAVAAKRKDQKICDNLLLIRDRKKCRQKASEIYP